MGIGSNRSGAVSGGAANVVPNNVLTSRTLLGEFPTVTNGVSGAISQTWGTLINDFSYMEIELVSNTDAPIRVTKTLAVQDWVNDTRVVMYSTANQFATVLNMDIAGDTFGYNASGATVADVTLRFYGIKEVVSNDTATSNYQDIGNTRIQWGSQASDGVVVLPMPFADTNYSVTTANSFTTAGRTSQIINTSKTTTQFTIRAFSGNNQSATGCNWQAIGVKP